MNPLIWTTDDALALRCPVEAVGTLRETQEVIEGRAVPAPAGARIASFALAHLCRIAQGWDHAAVAACRELLARCPPEPSGAPDPAQAPMPDWLTARRLLYQEEQAGAAHALPGPGDDGAHVDNL
jgi:hypothetical protein